MPDPQARADSLVAMLREWLTPKPTTRPVVITGRGGQLEIPDVPSPYPFKNPITPTKAIDEQVRRLRSLAPGAGTATREIQNIAPPKGIMAAAFRSLPDFARGNNLNETNIAGATDVSSGPKHGNVYINPIENYVEQNPNTIAHELTHAAGYNERNAQDAGKAYDEYQQLLEAIRAATVRAKNKK